MSGNIVAEALLLIERPIAKAVLSAAETELKSLTPEQIKAAADWLNSKVGGNKPFEEQGMEFIIKGTIGIIDFLETLK